MAYQKHKILNGQYVNIEQTPASIGLRIAAYIIDCIIIWLYATAIASTLTLLDNSPYLPAIATAQTLPVIFYHPICELALGGSFGKRMLKMRVVMQNGESVSFSSTFLRWILYIIDAYIFYLGIIAMLCNKKNMRLGDMAAGTIVIKENSVSEKSISRLHSFTFLHSDYAPTYPFVTQLTWGQIDFINHTMSHKGDFFYAPNQLNNIQMLARKIADRFHVTDITPANSNRFLRTLVADYNYYTWTDND